MEPTGKKSAQKDKSDEAGSETHALPLVEERLRVARRTTTARVVVRQKIEETRGVVADTVETQSVEVRRVPVGKEVSEIPPIRRDGDDVIVPVVEEILVLEKRLILKEEVRVSTVSRVDAVEAPYALKSASVVVERHDPSEEQEK